MKCPSEFHRKNGHPHPEIYVNEKDKESMDMIWKINEIHIDIKIRFNSWFKKDPNDPIQVGLYEFIEESLYRKTLTKIPEKYADIREEIEGIMNGSEQKGVKKLNIHEAYNKKYNEDIKNLKSILLSYAHYKK